MTTDLFCDNSSGDPLPRLLPIPDAQVYLMPSLPLTMPADELFDALHRETPWRTETISLFGKRHPQPRLSAWFGDPGTRYAYSGLALDPLPWTPLLAALKTAVERCSRACFNSVLLNLYRDHRDSMGLHSDSEPELGPAPVIASLSLGEVRTFILKHKTRPELKRVRIPLPSGSLLVMQGATQAHWRHGIDKERVPCGPRINLTFRFVAIHPTRETQVS